MKQTRLEFLDFMRGIAILNVLLIHQGFTVLDNFTLAICHRLCIPVFVFVTGYTVGFSQDKPYIENLIKKVSYGVHLFFVYLILTYLVVDNGIPMTQIFDNLLSGNYPEIKNAALWYLPFYISLYFVLWTEIKFIKLIYDLVLKRLNNLSTTFYYISLIIISVIVAYQGNAINIFEENIFMGNPFFVKHAFIMQPFAVLGYIMYCVGNEQKELGDNTVKISKMHKVIILSLIKFVIFLISFLLFVNLSKKYGIIDVRPMVWTSLPSFYFSTICAVIFLYMLSKYICILLGDFILVKYVAYCGKRSIHICAIHLLVLSFMTNYLKFIPNLYSLVSEMQLQKLILQTIVLSLISIFISYAIEREK